MSDLVINRSKKVRITAIAIIAAALVTVTGQNVFAGLNATASANQSQGAGSLSLTTSNNGVGFSQSLTNLAPGDTVNRYVTLTNGGTLDAQALGLVITATGTPTLITDGTAPSTSKALTVAVSSCTGGTWNTSTGICSGTTNVEIATTTLADFASNKSFAISSTLASAATASLQIQVKLPDQNETTVNGIAPTTSVQSSSVALTFVFSETQRTATTRNN